MRVVVLLPDAYGPLTEVALSPEAGGDSRKVAKPLDENQGHWTYCKYP